MKSFLKTAVETGMPYVFYRDTVNHIIQISMQVIFTLLNYVQKF